MTTQQFLRKHTARTVARIDRKKVVSSLCLVLAVLIASHSSTVWAVVGGRSTGGGPVSNSGHVQKQATATGSNLQGWYPFDGNPTDLSAGSRTGTTNNVTAVPGKIGQAYSFNGTDSYVRTPSYALSGTAITISAWINTTQQAYNQTLAASGIQSPTTGFLFTYRATSSDNLAYQYTNGTLAKTLVASNFFTGYNNTWMHVTMVADYTAGTVDFYRNGVLFSTATATPGDTMQFPSVNQVKYIGTYTPSLHTFGGQIDDFRLYTSALSAADITKIYAGSTAPTCDQTCVGWWKLDETSGTSATDSSGNGNTGTYTNGALVNREGIYAGGVGLDGVNDYINVPNSPSLTIGTGEVSVSFWLKTMGPLGTLVDKKVAGTNTAGYTFTLNGSSQMTFRVANGSAQSIATCSLAICANMTDGTWHHWAGTVNRTTNLVSLYMDGKFIISNPITAGWDLSSTIPLSIGSLGSGAGFSTGNIDDVRIYTRSLTSYEVADQYLAGRP